MKNSPKRPPDQESNPWVGRVARLRRLSFRFALAAGTLLLLVGGYQLLIHSRFLALQQIEVKTEAYLDRREVVHWVGLKPGESLVTLNLAEIRKKAEAHPWVERAWVTRTFPHTVEIRIRERRPVAKVIVEGETYLLGATGTIFPPLDRSLEGPWLTLVGLKEADLRRRPEACQRVVKEAVELLALLKVRPDWKIREVGLDPDQGLRLALEDGPWDIRLGLGDLKERIERLEKILEHLEKEGRRHQTQWIDLRYPRRATAKVKG